MFILTGHGHVHAVSPVGPDDRFQVYISRQTPAELPMLVVPQPVSAVWTLPGWDGGDLGHPFLLCSPKTEGFSRRKRTKHATSWRSPVSLPITSLFRKRPEIRPVVVLYRGPKFSSIDKDCLHGSYKLQQVL